MVVSSKAEYADAREFGIRADKIHVIPAGIDIPSAPGNPTSTDGPLHILFVGRIARVRRIEWVLQAASTLTFPWKLSLVGGEEETSSLQRSGYVAELKQLCEELNIAERVHFAGAQSPDKLNSYYNEADVFVYPSRYENFGQPILEAAAVGLPIVSTPVGVARDLIEPGVTGFFIEEGPDSIRRHLETLNADSERGAMGKRLRDRVREQFDWDRIIQQYIELYQSL